MKKFKYQPGFQFQFSSTKADIAIGGGAAGAGKTYSELMEALKWVRYPGYNAIIFRRTQPEIRGQGGLWDQSIDMYMAAGGEPREHTLEWKFKTSGSPSRIQFASMQYDKDRFEHQGRSYALVEFDELTHFTKTMFWYLLRSLRSTCGVPPYLRATCNPDPDSFVRQLIDWWIGPDGYPIQNRAGVLRWFVRVNDDLIWSDSKDDLISRYPEIPPRSLTFIPGKLEDNKILTDKDPGYYANLMAMPYVDRMQQLHGNWNIRPSAGLYFPSTCWEIVEQAPADARQRVRAWDKAATKKTNSNDPSWTVGTRMSVDKNGVYYIEDVIRFQEGPLEVQKRMFNAASQDQPGTRIWMWRDPGQAGKVDIMSTQSVLSRFEIRGEKASKSKIEYAKPYSAAAEAGNIKLVRGKWNQDFIDEHQNFPDGPKNDQVDSASLAYLKLNKFGSNRVISLDTEKGIRDWKWSDSNGD